MHRQHELLDLPEKGGLPGKTLDPTPSLIRYLHQHDETMQFTVLFCLSKMRVMHAASCGAQ
jgi:hypothetical protein